jgi:hypothetical protein
MKTAAFNTGSDIHLLDHIAPLASLLQIPLIVTEELNAELGARYYPDVEIQYWPDLEHRLGEICEQYDALIECKYWQPHLKYLFQTLYKKKMHLIFCPHGFSDKGTQTPLLAPYATQDAALLYGPRHFEMLKTLNALPPLYIFVGNYRLTYSQKHPLLLPKKGKTVLYAPTWRDADQSTSFFDYGAKVIQELPNDWNLILKPHPLLEQRDPAQFYRLTALGEKKENVLLLNNFPPVYPVLSIADIYLGDASSVGYDFLYFNRPLYFFPSKQNLPLHRAGKVIDPTKNLYLQMDVKPKDQTAFYEEVFGYSPIGGSTTTLSKSFKRLATGLTKAS